MEPVTDAVIAEFLDIQWFSGDLADPGDLGGLGRSLAATGDWLLPGHGATGELAGLGDLDDLGGLGGLGGGLVATGALLLLGRCATGELARLGDLGDLGGRGGLLVAIPGPDWLVDMCSCLMPVLSSAGTSFLGKGYRDLSALSTMSTSSQLVPVAGLLAF